MKNKKSTIKASDILDVNGTSLEEWLGLLLTPPEGKTFVRNMFPTEAHREAWLSASHSRSESDVKLILRDFWYRQAPISKDDYDAAYIFSKMQEDPTRTDLGEHERRLLIYHRSGGKYPVWEGLGWVIDLLPHYPRKALEVIDAFFSAPTGKGLPTNDITGLFDAMTVIRNRYIESSHTADEALKVLQGLEWRELEWLCGTAYDHMGFSVEVTSPGNDDGVDVFARKHTKGEKGLVVIQAKKWAATNPVGKGEVEGTFRHCRSSQSHKRGTRNYWTF